MDAIVGGIVGACVTAGGAVIVALVQRGRAAARAEIAAPPPSAPLRTETDAWREAIEGRVTALEKNDRREARLIGELRVEIERLKGEGGHGREFDAG